MATLPSGAPNLTTTITAAQMPTRTWFCNQETGRIQGDIDGFEAARQAVEVILSTERYKWPIYRPSSGVEYGGLAGADPGFVFIEVQRRVKDALRMDARVTSVDGFAYSMDGGNMLISFTVHTVYGDIRTDTLEVISA